MKSFIIGIIFLGIGVFLGGNGGYEWVRALKVKALEVVAEQQGLPYPDLGGKEYIVQDASKKYIVQDSGGSPTSQVLTTIKTFTGTGSKELYYTVASVPAVFNVSYVKQGKINTPFHVSVDRVIASGVTVEVIGNVISQTGDYKIVVDATGYKWQIDIGVE